MAVSIFTDSEKEEIFQDLLRDLKPVIAFNTVRKEQEGDAPFGREMLEALDHMVAFGRKNGIRAEKLGNVCGWFEFGNPDSKEMIAVACHLDIVPFGDENSWDTPPLEMTVGSDRISGRGVLDNKGPLLLCYEILKKLTEKNTPFKHRIRLIFGCAEETGSECMEYYSKHGEIPEYGFTADCDYPLIYGEKGLMHFDFVRKFAPGENPLTKINGGFVRNAVPGEAYAEWKGGSLQAIGKTAHASLPQDGENAILKLGAELEKAAGPCEVTKFLRLLNKKDLNIDLKDQYSELTFVPSVINGDTESVTIQCDIRFPLTMRSTEVLERLRNATRSTGWELVTAQIDEPLFYDPESPLVTSLLQAYRDVTGEKDAQGIIVGGGTYAKHLPNILAYGVCLPDDPATAHKINEFWLFRSIRKNIDLLAAGILALDQL